LIENYKILDTLVRDQSTSYEKPEDSRAGTTLVILLELEAMYRVSRFKQDVDEAEQALNVERDEHATAVAK